MGWWSSYFWSFAWVGVFLKWCGEAVQDGKGGNPSVKRFGFIMVLTFICGVLTGLTLAIHYVALKFTTPANAPMVLGSLLSTLEVLVGMALTAVTTGYLAGKSIENKRPMSTTITSTTETPTSSQTVVASKEQV